MSCRVAPFLKPSSATETLTSSTSVSLAAAVKAGLPRISLAQLPILESARLESLAEVIGGLESGAELMVSKRGRLNPQLPHKGISPLIEVHQLRLRACSASQLTDEILERTQGILTRPFGRATTIFLFIAVFLLFIQCTKIGISLSSIKINIAYYINYVNRYAFLISGISA